VVEGRGEGGRLERATGKSRGEKKKRTGSSFQRLLKLGGGEKLIGQEKAELNHITPWKGGGAEWGGGGAVRGGKEETGVNKIDWSLKLG